MQTLLQSVPNLHVTASYEVLPEMKEYERTSTTVVNAYLLPTDADISRATRRSVAPDGHGRAAAGDGLERRNHRRRGCRRLPVFAVASGPAGGVTGAAALARGLATGDFIVFDMGGTTAKASILENGRPPLVTEYEFRDGMSSPSRFVKGGGYMLKVPSIDIAEVGAGGGSLASVDEGGLLHVGPSSAGARSRPGMLRPRQRQSRP